MKSITSRDNSLFKELKLLATSSQARRKSARTLLDGTHLCESYLDHRGKPKLCVVAESGMRHPEIEKIIAHCNALHAECAMLPDSLYQALSQVEHGVGIFFLIDTPQLAPPTAITQSAVILDQLQDPGNLGSILRSAAAAGIKNIYCSAGTVFSWSPKVLRAGMGAHFLLNIHENVDLRSLLSAADVPVLATSSHAEHRLYDMDLTKPVAWLFGHEGQGVSEDLMAVATHRLAIPHLGEIESLNVAACAAVCLFEQVRQQSCS